MICGGLFNECVVSDIKCDISICSMCHGKGSGTAKGGCLGSFTQLKAVLGKFHPTEGDAGKFHPTFVPLSLLHVLWKRTWHCHRQLLGKVTQLKAVLGKFHPTEADAGKFHPTEGSAWEVSPNNCASQPAPCVILFS